MQGAQRICDVLQKVKKLQNRPLVRVRNMLMQRIRVPGSARPLTTGAGSSLMDKKRGESLIRSA